MPISLDKVGSGSVDSDKYNALIDALATLAGSGLTHFTMGLESVTVSNLVLGGGGNGSFTMAHGGGDTLLDYSTATTPKVLNAGFYVLCGVFSPNAAFTGIAQVSLFAAANQSIHPYSEKTLLTATQPEIFSLFAASPMAVNDTIQATGNISSGGGTTFTCASLTVAYLKVT